MDFNDRNDISFGHPSWEGNDHLPYLKEKPSIFEDEDDEKLRKSRHDHGFRYFNQTVQLGCFRNAKGCVGVQRISKGYSWFRGYAWQIQVCGNCYTQLGWKYMSEDESFYGLIFKTLREVEAEANGEG
jgi:hypothetical protein